ncbi:hypothetical protein, partial [Streptomyces lunaelactis]
SQTLASSASDKNRAATYMEEHLLRDTAAAGRMTEGGGRVRPPLVGPPSPAAPVPSVLTADTGLKGLSGWAAEAGLSEAMTTWQGQVNRLMGQLNRELQGLRGAKTVLQGQDIGTYSQFNSVQVEPPLLRSPFNGM